MNKYPQILAAILSVIPVLASAQCPNEDLVRSIDNEWEQALNYRSTDTYERILHDDFVWVHNHAGSVQDSKTNFIEFLTNRFENLGPIPNNARQGIRTQHDVKVIMTSNTAIVYGFMDIKRPGGKLSEPDTRPLLFYHFMRTYVSTGSGCKLISNHTMNLPDN